MTATRYARVTADICVALNLSLNAERYRSTVESATFASLETTINGLLEASAPPGYDVEDLEAALGNYNKAIALEILKGRKP